MSHTKPYTYTDVEYCGICDKNTKQTIHESGHERDSSGCWRRCTVCNSYYSGYDGNWHEPIKIEEPEKIIK